MITKVIRKIVGSRNERQIRHMQKTVTGINGLEPESQKLSDSRPSIPPNPWALRARRRRRFVLAPHGVAFTRGKPNCHTSEHQEGSLAGRRVC